MIPILYDSKEKNFTSQGMGALKDAISCKVTEERNGIYELEMAYPQTGIHFGEIQEREIIYAIPSPFRDPQPFRIYKITKPLNGNVTIYAQHISYDLNGIPVTPFTAQNVAMAFSGLESNAAIENEFSFSTDFSKDGNFLIQIPTAIRSCLGGQTGSVLDVYGGEFEWDKFAVKLHASRGTDSGVVIRYGKNLTGLTQESDIENLVTGIYPYWFQDDTLVESDPKIVYSKNIAFQKAVPVDFTQDFEEQPTPEQLKEAAENYITQNQIGEPTVSITVEFLQLSKLSGFEKIALLEKCDLCDEVTVQYEEAGIDIKAKVVSIQTDVLLERYDQMEIGSIRANIAQTIAGQQQQITQNKEDMQSYTQQAVNNATNWITGGKGGYVIFHRNANGQPDEILVMDTYDISTAQKVWRWNQGGLGYSENGYSGPYTTAITQDGQIVADFITTGQLSANRISAGTIEGQIIAKDLIMQGGTIDITTDEDGNKIVINGKTTTGSDTSIYISCVGVKASYVNESQGTKGSINLQPQAIYIKDEKNSRSITMSPDLILFTDVSGGIKIENNSALLYNSPSLVIDKDQISLSYEGQNYNERTFIHPDGITVKGIYGINYYVSEQGGAYREGVSGTFTSNDGKTIEVINGIIVDI